MAIKEPGHGLIMIRRVRAHDRGLCVCVCVCVCYMYINQKKICEMSVWKWCGSAGRVPVCQCIRACVAVCVHGFGAEMSCWCVL